MRKTMRKILFKAKDNEGTWVYGHPYQHNEIWLMKEVGEYKNVTSLIDPSTICQWICEINGQEFWENDIVQHEVVLNNIDYWVDENGQPGYRSVETDRFLEYSYLTYIERGFHVKHEDHYWNGSSNWNWNEMKVVGNMFDDREKYEPLFKKFDDEPADQKSLGNK